MIDERTKKSEDPGRVSRASQDRNKTENRVISDQERLDLFEAEQAGRIA